jgi:hypothetical protein
MEYAIGAAIITACFGFADSEYEMMGAIGATIVVLAFLTWRTVT